MSLPSPDTPFRAVVSPGFAAEPGDPAPTTAAAAAADDWSPEDLEAAYLRALEAAEFADQQLTAEIDAAVDECHVPPLGDPDAGESAATPLADGNTATAAAEAETGDAEPPSSHVTPRQVLEALLFVGGEPLTGKRLVDLLRGGFTHEQVDELIEDLNRQYQQEGRPYEIRLGPGGYRLELAPEFEPVRNRVYGLGPRDVKLSQDALEVLALVAYQQPVHKDTVEATGKPNAGALLRQLLRRELIELERSEDDGIRYRTTPRFLELFGLQSIDDLPQPDDLIFK